MKHNFRISFFLKKSKEKKNGKSPIICRITINGNRTELSTQLEIESAKWNVSVGKVEGRSNAVKFVNQTLDSIKMTSYIAYRNLQEQGNIITPGKVKRAYTQTGRYPQTLLGFFKKHNDDEFKLIGHGRSYSTYKKYDLSYRRVKEFLKFRYRKDDNYSKMII